jgi:hypothetical protein
VVCVMVSVPITVWEDMVVMARWEDGIRIHMGICLGHIGSVESREFTDTAWGGGKQKDEREKIRRD